MQRIVLSLLLILCNISCENIDKNDFFNPPEWIQGEWGYEPIGVFYKFTNEDFIGFNFREKFYIPNGKVIELIGDDFYNFKMIDSNGKIKHEYKIKKICKDSIKLWKDDDDPFTYSRIN